MKGLFLLFIGVFVMPESVTAHHCGRGWVSFEKNCYYFSTSAVTFNDAMVACDSRGSSVLVIRNSREEKWLDLHCRLRGYVYGLWLGISDVQREGYMVAISDRSRLSYVNWIKGQPDNYRGNEHCALYWPALKAWNDISCSSKVHFVCTKK
uniref:Perlucin-like protein n=1 Tax=Crassostrea virginica TaxID=6565 RepID=A0A8B8BP04_CRAVI|nr:perlucin-like protein [Crassostrea virginica]